MTHSLPTPHLASNALLFLLLVVTTATLGGLGPALLACALSSVLLNFFLTEPFHTFRTNEGSQKVGVSGPTRPT